MVRWYFNAFCARKTRQSYTETGIWGIIYASKKDIHHFGRVFWHVFYCNSKTPAMRSGVQYASLKRHVNIPLGSCSTDHHWYCAFNVCVMEMCTAGCSHEIAVFPEYHCTHWIDVHPICLYNAPIIWWAPLASLRVDFSILNAAESVLILYFVCRISLLIIQLSTSCLPTRFLYGIRTEKWCFPRCRFQDPQRTNLRRISYGTDCH